LISFKKYPGKKTKTSSQLIADCREPATVKNARRQPQKKGGRERKRGWPPTAESAARDRVLEVVGVVKKRPSKLPDSSRTRPTPYGRVSYSVLGKNNSYSRKKDAQSTRQWWSRVTTRFSPAKVIQRKLAILKRQRNKQRKKGKNAYTQIGPGPRPGFGPVNANQFKSQNRIWAWKDDRSHSGEGTDLGPDDHQQATHQKQAGRGSMHENVTTQNGNATTRCELSLPVLQSGSPAHGRSTQTLTLSSLLRGGVLSQGRDQ